MAKIAAKKVSKKSASKSLYEKAGYVEVKVANKTPEQLEIEELRKKKREAIKEFDKRIKAKKMSARHGQIENTWKKLEDIKKMVSQALKDSGLSGAYDLKKIATKVPDYYIYQHPTKKILKTNDKQAQWVVDFLKRGSEQTLIDTANKTRNEYFISQTTKTKKRNKTTTNTPPTTDTSQAEGIG